VTAPRWEVFRQASSVCWASQACDRPKTEENPPCRAHTGRGSGFTRCHCSPSGFRSRCAVSLPSCRTKPESGAPTTRWRRDAPRFDVQANEIHFFCPLVRAGIWTSPLRTASMAGPAQFRSLDETLIGRLSARITTFAPVTTAAWIFLGSTSGPARLVTLLRRFFGARGL